MYQRDPIDRLFGVELVDPIPGRERQFLTFYPDSVYDNLAIVGQSRYLRGNVPARSANTQPGTGETRICLPALCRLSEGFQSLITSNPQSAKIGCENTLVIASGFVLNWILFVWSAVMFYRILLAWDVDARVATLRAAEFTCTP